MYVECADTLLVEFRERYVRPCTYSFAVYDLYVLAWGWGRVNRRKHRSLAGTRNTVTRPMGFRSVGAAKIRGKRLRESAGIQRETFLVANSLFGEEQSR